MKKCMTNYLYALSEDDADVLFEIISFKYRKFIDLYWLLKDYSDNITSLRYKDKTEKNILQIAVTFSGIESKAVARILKSSPARTENVSIDVVDKNSMMIELRKEETV